MGNIFEYFEVDKCAQAYIIMICVGLFIYFCYGGIINKFYRKGDMSIPDPMNIKMKTFPYTSGWVASHFIFYFILGFMFPYCARGILTIGLLWEIFESVLGYIKKSKDDCPKELNKENFEYTRSWWTGTVKDVIVNTCGFLFGMLMNMIVYKK
jgi:hypothetical protein